MNTFADAGVLCNVLFIACCLIFLAFMGVEIGVQIRHRFGPRDPGPNHPARRGLPEVGDDTLAMIAGGNFWDD